MQSWQKRMNHECKKAVQFPLQATEDPLIWTSILKGPPGSFYEGAQYDIELRITTHYPFEAPYVRFLTPIYHVNVHESGQPYCPIVMESWSASRTLESIMLYLEDILMHPNPAYLYNYEAGLLLQQDKSAYEKAVQAHVADVRV